MDFRRKQICIALAALAIAGQTHAQQPALADLSLEELSSIEITSVSRVAERLSDAPASIFVITSEDIRRYGANTLTEALRLAPNLQVARAGANNYAISARGFNNIISNKLLVLVDGRTIYTPLFSGVFWDQQDVMLEDVERIEVISGPGATLWGANAVDGVINVITRPASGTQGTLATLGAGTHEQGAAVRHGGTLGNGGHFRVYGKTHRLQNTRTQSGAGILDGTENWQAGFRTDWRNGRDAFTVQGDAYTGESDHRGFVGAFEFRPIRVSGANLLGRWTRQLSDASDLRVQAYFDYAERDDVFLFSPTSNIADIEFDHSIRRGRHRFLWGGGYRYGRDNVQPGVVDLFVPQSTGRSWGNVFVQDEFQLTDRLELTAGLKVESNRYTGNEYLPSVRLAYKLAPNRLLWSALSRAVRAPSRFDRDVFFPGTRPPIRIGSPNFESEVANVLEVGYRAQPGAAATYSVTAFYHAWDKLRSANVPFGNNMVGSTYGIETWASWQATRNWRLSAGLTTLRMDLHYTPAPGPEVLSIQQLANDPEYQGMVRSTLNLSRGHELDVMARLVGQLPNPGVPAYTAVDASYSLPLRRDLRLSVVGRNLFDPGHPEFQPGTLANRSEIGRALLVQLRWTR